MEPVFAVVVGALFAASTFLMLQRNVLKIVFGLVLLSNAANLLIFTMGRLTPNRPPLIPEGATAPAAPFANPLPQALILTAIVISFGLLAFSLVLVYRAYQEIGTVDSDRMQEEEPQPEVRMEDPAEAAAEVVGA